MIMLIINNYERKRGTLACTVIFRIQKVFWYKYHAQCGVNMS